ncbi:MAG: DinB family protein, partial [Anaerolineaceae bacterium]
GTYSAMDVLGHFIHGEQTDWMPRTQIILESGEARPFEPFDMQGHEAVIRGKSASELLDTFAVLRKQNLTALRELNLDDAKMDRTGMHPALGRVTLRNMLAAWVVHDLGHTSQITRIMARQYADAVGPWRPRMTFLGTAR